MNKQKAIKILEDSNKTLRVHMILAKKEAWHLGQYGYSCRSAAEEYRAVKIAIRVLKQAVGCRTRRKVRRNGR